MPLFQTGSMFHATFSVCGAQYDFSPPGNWLKENTPAMGGRSTLIIFKSGKIFFSCSVNDLSKKQKFIGRLITQKAGEEPLKFNKDFSVKKKIRVTSCSTFPRIDNKYGYAAVLFSFNLNYKGRHDLYLSLNRIVDKAFAY